MVTDLTAACVLQSTTYFDQAQQMAQRPITAGELVLWSGIEYRLDEQQRDVSATRVAEIWFQGLAKPELIEFAGYVPANDIGAGLCPNAKGAADDFESTVCASSPIDDPAAKTTVGSSESKAMVVDSLRVQSQADCIRMVFEFRVAQRAPGRLLPVQVAPLVTVTSGSTETQIALPEGFDASAFSEFPSSDAFSVAFAGVGDDGVSYLQILHAPAVVRAQVLEGPARLVIDFAPIDSAEPYYPPIVGSNVIISEPLDPTDDGFVSGQEITMTGWIRPAQGATPSYRVLALEGSAGALLGGQDGPIPFLAASGTPELSQDPATTGQWVPFTLAIDTQDWFGASHAVIVGESGPEGFVGSGEIVQFIDRDGQRQPNYDVVPSQIVVDADPSSWVKQG